jgi:hypothetical protein
LILAAIGGRALARSTDSKTWQQIATEPDRTRIRTWRDAWTQAIAKITAAGQANMLTAQGALLEPDSALSDPTPPPGDYSCRTYKLGSQGTDGLNYVAYPAFTCRISTAGTRLRFVKVDGSQRPGGMLYPGDDARMIFLGTMMLGDETRAMNYGRDPDRDMAGALERIGRHRWRLVLPFPKWESTLDVIELVPKG